MRPFDQVFHILKYRKHKQLVPLVDNFLSFKMCFMYFLESFAAYSVYSPPMGVETKQVKIALP